MKMKRILLIPSLLTAYLLGSATPGWAQAFQRGEILIAKYARGIERYSASGNLLQTYDAPGVTDDLAASLTPEGYLITSCNIGLAIFSSDGTLIQSFVTPNSHGDVSVFANGAFALNVQDTVQFWQSPGTLLQTVSLPGLSAGSPNGSTLGSDGILCVAGNASHNIARVDSSGNFLGLISLSFRPGDLVMNPLDGTLWVSGETDELVHHITTDGTVLGSFATGFSGTFDGIGLAPDGDSLSVCDNYNSGVKHFDLGGNLLDSFPDPGVIPIFMTVVPHDFTIPAPEPGSLTLLLGSGALLARRRRCRLLW